MNRLQPQWLLVLLSGCVGTIIGSSEPGPTTSPQQPMVTGAGGGTVANVGGGSIGTAGGTTQAGGGTAHAPVVTPITSMRRLSLRELDRTIAMLTGSTTPHAARLLPSATATPFDNATETQELRWKVTATNPILERHVQREQHPSASWVEGVEALAAVVTTETLADPARRARVLPCTPTSNMDMACMDRFITTFGRRVLRRPLTAAEVTRLKSLHAQALERGDFMTSVGLVMQRLLMSPEFHFRPEIGTPTGPNEVKLNAFELASRLAFFFQGRGPSDWLLDAAQAGELDTKAGLRTAANRLLSEPEGRAHVQAFHAMWLGYASLPHDAALNQRFTTESSALVDRVVFDQPGDFRRLFSSTETYADAELATHYGLPAGTAPYSWRSYANTGRKGILSHGAILSNGTKQADSSPTLRGLFIRTRLFCQEIPPPPPNVPADLPPASQSPSPCKKDRLAAHINVGSCFGCHVQMDPIGFGLERYDRTGKYRTVETAHPQCSIDGVGELAGVGRFSGPSELTDLLVSSGNLEPCVVKQLFRFGNGRHEYQEDDPLLERWATAFDGTGRRFDQLMVEMALDDTFSQRRMESAP